MVLAAKERDAIGLAWFCVQVDLDSRSAVDTDLLVMVDELASLSGSGIAQLHGK